MEAILLKFKVFETDWGHNKRDYKDMILNPNNIISVYEEFDREAQKNDTIIEFDHGSTSADRRSNIERYKTEEKLTSVMDRVNSRQVLETGVAPSISMPNAYLSDE